MDAATDFIATFFSRRSIDLLPVAIAFAAIAFLYFKRKFSYWARLGLKSPTPIPWFGTTLYPLIKPKPILELELHQKLGKLYGLYDGFLGTNPTLVCGHPEVLKQVTIKHFDSFTNRRRPSTWKSIRYRALTYMRDEEWKNLRKILAPTFTSNKLKRMYELMKRCTRNLQSSIEMQNGQEIDLKKLFSVFTVDIISTCCFSMDLKDYRDPESDLLLSARKFFNVSRFKMGFSVAIPKHFLKIFGFDINDTTSIDFFARFATEIINKRRALSSKQNFSQASKNKQDDFLQILIDAASEFNERKTTTTGTTSNNMISHTDTNNYSSGVGNNNNNNNNNNNENKISTSNQHLQQDLDSGSLMATTAQENVAIKPDTREQADEQGDNQRQEEQQASKRFTEQQLGDLEILAQSMLFFAVGHETTATLLSSCGMFLALYPHMQDRLYNEISAAFSAGNGDITYEKLLELQYLDAFISEALRYYTPTLTFDREASEDVEIEVEGKKMTIPAGMGVIIPFHAIHHDPDNYEDPERFDPERFMPENRHKIKPCTFIPFGVGPRFCLASRFALIEAKLALANLVNKFKFVKSEGTIFPPKFRHHYMLMQMEWPKIRFIDRKLAGLEPQIAQTAA